MKPFKYNDDQFCREGEEDWEASGHEEVNKIHDQLRKSRRGIIEVRDEVNDLIDLLAVCSSALLNEHASHPTKVAHVLSVFVGDKLKELEKELATL